MKRRITIIIAIIASTIVATSCRHQKQSNITADILDNANSYFTAHDLKDVSSHVMFVHGKPQLDVVGLITEDKQNELLVALEAGGYRPHVVRFWKEKPTLPFHVIIIPEASFESDERRETEMQTFLLRSESINQ